MNEIKLNSKFPNGTSIILWSRPATTIYAIFNNNSDTDDAWDFRNVTTKYSFGQRQSNNLYNNKSIQQLGNSDLHLMHNVTIESDKSINNYWALLAILLVFCTAAGNILVCLAIAWERRLQNVTNYFLMSLAITDLMVAILVMPLGILTLVRGKIFVCKFIR
jgi:hypothetical protein